MGLLSIELSNVSNPCSTRVRKQSIALRDNLIASLEMVKIVHQEFASTHSHFSCSKKFSTF